MKQKHKKGLKKKLSAIILILYLYFKISLYKKIILPTRR